MKKRCLFCQNKISEIDFKESALLTRFLSSWGKIKTMRETGCCARHQRQLAKAIKNARFMGLIPYVKR